VDIPTLTYSFDRKAEENLEETKMEYLRNAVGYTAKDQIRNTMIRNEINIFNLNNGMIKRRINQPYRGVEPIRSS
jgi:hypothetical protein